jgi:hypothetical protein
MNLTWNACECSRPKRHSASAIVERYRVSRVTKDATPEDLKINRRRVVTDMVRMRRQLMIDGQRKLAVFLREMFTRQINQICDRMEEVIRGRNQKARVEIDLGDPVLEAMWVVVLEEVLGANANVEMINRYLPVVQSVAARAAVRTSLFIGEAETVVRTPPAATPPPRVTLPGAEPASPPTSRTPGSPPPAPPNRPTVQPAAPEPDPEVNAAIHQRAQRMAEQVTRINETTRRRLVDALKRGMADGQTIPEIVKSVRASVPEIHESRIPNIVRTEIGRAIDEGTKEALKRSKTVTHVSVVGCVGREPNSPQIDGQSTCNFQDLAIERIELLVFHPQHTGCITPSRYVNDKPRA